MIAHAVAFNQPANIVWAVPSYLFNQGKISIDFALPFIVTKNSPFPEKNQPYSFTLKDKVFNGEFCRGELHSEVANNY